MRTRMTPPAASVEPEIDVDADEGGEIRVAGHLTPLVLWGSNTRRRRLCGVSVFVCVLKGSEDDVEGRWSDRAVLVMEVGPPGSLCRQRTQTAVVSSRSRAGVGSDCGKGSP